MSSSGVPVIQTSVVVASTNACSLVNKLDELNSVLEKVDVLAVTETWLTPRHGDALLPKGFTPYRCDRPASKGGGSLLLVKNHLKQRAFDKNFCSQGAQVVGCMLECTHRILIL